MNVIRKIVLLLLLISLPVRNSLATVVAQTVLPTGSLTIEHREALDSDFLAFSEDIAFSSDDDDSSEDDDSNSNDDDDDSSEDDDSNSNDDDDDSSEDDDSNSNDDEDDSSEDDDSNSNDDDDDSSEDDDSNSNDGDDSSSEDLEPTEDNDESDSSEEDDTDQNDDDSSADEEGSNPEDDDATSEEGPGEDTITPELPVPSAPEEDNSDEPTVPLPDTPSSCDKMDSSFECTCSAASDSDGDGTFDCFETEKQVLIPAGLGCGDLMNGAEDNDLDGTPNCEDMCANDPAKTMPGICGCGISDADLACLETCQPGVENLGCGCGITPCGIDDQYRADGTERPSFFTNYTVHVKAPDVSVRYVDEKPLVDVGFEVFRRAVALKEETTAGFRLAAHQETSPELSKLTKQIRSLQRKERKASRRRRTRITYEVIIETMNGNRTEVFLKMRARRNRIILNAMPPGIFVIRYRAMLFMRKSKALKRERETVHKTAFSPSVTFTIM